MVSSSMMLPVYPSPSISYSEASWKHNKKFAKELSIEEEDHQLRSWFLHRRCSCRFWVPLLNPTSSSSFSLPPPPLSNPRRRSNFSPLVITASAVFAAPSDVNNSVPGKNGAYTSLVALDSISDGEGGGW
ncbi:hypothetical protein Bca52824_054710 [Brassica carinata]|uniref:Uncharacterized protein n=1 Tax=Brassica carinata TaxID=52824 RepID=A0A8X7R7Y4_BRACI|nr:hypothetical protein Bca52824_054710 [Brassica carinata]